MNLYSYKSLKSWQKSIELTHEIYRLTRLLPKEELFGLSSQMRKAAVSIPSNIAEGQDRNSKKEFIMFLGIARGSRAELETQLYICVGEGFITSKEAEKANELLGEIGGLITGHIRKLKSEILFQSQPKTDNGQPKTDNG